MSRHDSERRRDAPAHMTRRQALMKLGLVGLAAYAAPTFLTLSDASAHSRVSFTTLTSIRVRRRRKFVKKPVRKKKLVKRPVRRKIVRLPKHHYDYSYYYDHYYYFDY